jgi:hypothetical protein
MYMAGLKSTGDKRYPEPCKNPKTATAVYSGGVTLKDLNTLYIKN